MTWPGESVIIKLWETLADRGIGGLLRPWQERRVGTAQAEVRAKEIVLLAKAQADADRIATFSIQTNNSSTSFLEFKNSPSSETNLANTLSPTNTQYLEFDPEIISDIVERKDLAGSIRREVNVAKAALVAEDILATVQTAPHEARIDVDWLGRWEEYAGQVSADELQEIWGRVLADEILAPGTNTLRLLEFLKTVSRVDAEKIEVVAPYVFCGIIAKSHQDYLDEMCAYGKPA